MYFFHPFFLGKELKINGSRGITKYTVVSMQILRHSWLEQHFTILRTKVHFLGQVLDYNGQIWLKFEYNGTKKPWTEIRMVPFYLRRCGNRGQLIESQFIGVEWMVLSGKNIIIISCFHGKRSWKKISTLISHENSWLLIYFQI